MSDDREALAHLAGFRAAREMAAVVCDGMYGTELREPIPSATVCRLAARTIRAIPDPTPPAAQAEEPLPMLLWCPLCHTQHVDAPSPGWDNSPHKSHLCHACGCIWRPADVPTTGVEKIATKGSADNWPGGQPAPAPADAAVMERARRFASGAYQLTGLVCVGSAITLSRALLATRAALEAAQAALRSIRDFPVPEQDNMIAVNMRTIARAALGRRGRGCAETCWPSASAPWEGTMASSERAEG